MEETNSLVSLKFNENFEPDEGIDVIRKQIKHSAFLEVFNIPVSFFDNISDVMKDKKITIYAHFRLGIPKGYSRFSRLNNTELEVNYHGNSARLGIISFGMRGSFNIIYGEKEKIYDISSVSAARCPKCMLMSNVHLFFLSQNLDRVHFGEIYSIQRGIKTILQKLNTCKNAFLNNPPDFFLEAYLEHMEKRNSNNVRIILSKESRLINKMMQNFNVKVIPGIIKSITTYHGLRVNSCGIATDDIHFDIMWLKEKIFDVRAITWDVCTKCILNNYNAKWLICKKIPMPRKLSASNHN